MTINTTHFPSSIPSVLGLKYCFHIKLPDNNNLYLTELDKSILIDDKIFIPNSGMTLQAGEFNDSGQNFIIVRGIFENNGIEKHYDLTDAKVKIYQCFAQKINHFVSYRCSTYVKRDLDFTLYLTSNTDAYNQTVLQSYSQNCRANFGDSRCKIDKTMYSALYNIKEIFGKTIQISNLDKEDGYFTGGDVNLGEGHFAQKLQIIRAIYY